MAAKKKMVIWVGEEWVPITEAQKRHEGVEGHWVPADDLLFHHKSSAKKAIEQVAKWENRKLRLRRYVRQ